MKIHVNKNETKTVKAVQDQAVNAVVKIDDLHLAYLAGIIDGDGAIMALVDKKRVRVELALYNNCQDVLRFARERFVIGVLRKNKWSVRSDSGTKLLIGLLLPFLIVKKRQAVLALELVNSSDISERTELAKKISEMNVKSKKKFYLSTVTTDYYNK